MLAPAAAYPWPPLPDQATRQKASQLPAPRGVVLLQREVQLTIRSLGFEPFGVAEEQFLRFLVTSSGKPELESVDLTGEAEAKVTWVEGRTVLPDGEVFQLDEARDVERVTVRSGKAKEVLASQARVRFPHVTPGAVLDLHFKLERPGWVWAYGMPVTWPGIPALEAHYLVTLKWTSSPWTPVGWAVLALGPAKGLVQPTDRQDTMGVTLRNEVSQPAERRSVPGPHELPTVLAVMTLTGLRQVAAKGTFSLPLTVDDWGRVSGDFVTYPEETRYYRAFLQQELKKAKEFVGRGWSLGRDKLDSFYVPHAPLEERLRACYQFVQSQLTWRPAAREVDSLSKLLKKGMSSTDQGTFAFAALLEQLHIPHRLGWVANRYSYRFTPLIHNEYLFDLTPVVVVEKGAGDPWVLMAGDLALPFATLPLSYQHSVVLVLGKKRRARGALEPRQRSGERPGEPFGGSGARCHRRSFRKVPCGKKRR